MAEGRPLKRNAYMAAEGGQRTDIEMPPLDHPTVLQEAPNPWNQAHASQTHADNPFKVPEDLPQDVLQEMQGADTDGPDESEEVAETPEPIDRPAPSKPKEENFRNLRLAREKAERERDEAIAILKYQMQFQQNQPQQPEPEEDYGIGSDELAEGKHIRKVSKELNDIKKQLASYKAQSQQEIMEAKIRVQYPDFNKVVSEENVAILKEEHPEIAQMLIDNPDLYTKASSAYKVIKQFGIYREEIPMSRDKVQALKNVAKPKPMASINPQQGDTPLSKANAFAQGTLTEDMKAQLRKEMLQARRGL